MAIRESRDKSGKSYSPRRWVVDVKHGTDPITGKPNRKRQTVRGTKAEAKKVETRLLSMLQNGVRAEGGRITFAEYANEWHEGRVSDGERARNTLEGEARYIAVLNEVIGSIELQDINGKVVESALRTIRDTHKGRRGVRLTGNTMRKYYVCLNQIMKDAVNHDLIPKNPCDCIKAPKVDAEEKQPLDEGQLRQLMACIERTEREYRAALGDKEQRMHDLGKRYSRSAVRGISRMGNLMALRTAIATGMRLGELFGLEWGSVALKDKELTVKQAQTKHGELKQPKNDSSIRTIAIDQSLTAKLAEWKTLQRAAMLTLGVRQTEETPVFCNDKGEFNDLSNFRRWFTEWRDDNELPKFTPHQLRHTHATQLLAAGVDIKTVSSRLGHKNATTTLNIYSHFMPRNDREAAEIMASIVRGEAKTA